MKLYRVSYRDDNSGSGVVQKWFLRLGEAKDHVGAINLWNTTGNPTIDKHEMKVTATEIVAFMNRWCDSA